MEGFTGTELTCIRNERVVFAELDFSVTTGGALVLSGPNGSGKSSLLRVMAGISRPAEGQISWRGTPIAEDPETYFADMHYVGHRDAVKYSLTVRENLTFHCALRPVAPNIDRALDLTGLTALADLPARMLSAGQTRRLALARMLASPAPLWLLDEPTVSLDTRAMERLVAAIADHRAGGGIVVLSTNVALEIEGATTIDTSVFTGGNKPLWSGPLDSESPSGDEE
ncbi:MAG: Cytochrome c biogenesis ATP-binding export protein CcmA [Alphaproteobacteria bacterium MarineAlpha11_Bin1]|nr:MAG: Cytochrome c biogenesis ATP-binding export protein CcmA [Alphaproteobacteria bacterium MarineAlpha11_Bin1]